MNTLTLETIQGLAPRAIASGLYSTGVLNCPRHLWEMVLKRWKLWCGKKWQAECSKLSIPVQARLPTAGRETRIRSL